MAGGACGAPAAIERYLPGVDLLRDWAIEPEVARAVADSEAVVTAVPSKAFREVTRSLAGFSGVVVSVTKGIEHETGLTMCGVLGETAPKARRVALSGPTFALEVARNIPTACVVASDATLGPPPPRNSFFTARRFAFTPAAMSWESSWAAR